MKSISLFFGKLTLEKKILLVTLIPVLTVLLNLTPMLIGLVILILIDLITGIRKSLFNKKLPFNIFKAHFWKTLRSRGMRLTWRKTYEYGIGIIVFALFETVILKLSPIMIGSAQFSLTEIAIILATIIEIYSIFENMEAVSGNNLLKKLAILLPDPLRRLLNSKKQ